MAFSFIETDDKVIDLLNEQYLQAARDKAMFELLERSADRICVAADNLADAMNRLATATANQASDQRTLY